MTVRLLRLAARCPNCGGFPKLRVPVDTTNLFEGANPEQVVVTIQCQVKSCQRLYDILVKDFIDAA